MNWHTATVGKSALDGLLAQIRRSGGIVAYCRPDGNSVRVTWTTAAGDVA